SASRCRTNAHNSPWCTCQAVDTQANNALPWVSHPLDGFIRPVMRQLAGLRALAVRPEKLIGVAAATCAGEVVAFMASRSALFDIDQGGSQRAPMQRGRRQQVFLPCF